MKLGALDVLDKMLGIDDLVSRILPLVRRADREPTDTGLDIGPVPVARPGSNAEQWAAHVVRACESKRDLKTIGEWARLAGGSYSSLCESCRLLEIPPHQARDFARLLRAVVRAAQGDGGIVPLLYVSDARTLKKLLERAGFGTEPNPRMSIRAFLDRQHFVPQENQGLNAVRRALSDLGHLS